jgi:MinD-like ATPase involved in chromosome partitioning or flagellar assembly
MRTITFYSYKGGVGRTLALANVAKYLASFGQKVFAIDLDLEAPGLHYKLAGAAQQRAIEAGLVDVLDAFVGQRAAPESLERYVMRVDHRTDTRGSIHLMPAGHVPSAPYWKKLAQLSWHELFYAEGARGIPFFLELKERIGREFDPDYLLIDARTGITELGGMATTLLPDLVVCLLANNPESLEGARAVLRGIRRTPRLPGQDPVEILPVVTRIPKGLDDGLEERLIERVRAFLSEPADDLSDTLSVSEVFVLHSEPDLQIAEALRVGGDRTPDDSPLLRDYLRLFMRMFPAVVEPKLVAQVQSAVAEVMDDPDGSQRRLEALTTAFPHPISYRALLQFYRLRQVDPAQILRMAYRFWELSGRAGDPLLWEIVAAYEVDLKGAQLPWVFELFDAVWSAQATPDPGFGLRLAVRLARLTRKTDRAIEILDRITQRPDAGEAAVIELLGLLRGARRLSDALALIDRFKSTLHSSAEFQAAWAQVVTALEDPKVAQDLLESPEFKMDLVRQAKPAAWWALASLLGATDDGEADLDSALSEHVRRHGLTPEVVELAHIYRQLGRSATFESTLRLLIKDKERVETFLSGVFSLARDPQRSPAARTWIPPRGAS